MERRAKKGKKEAFINLWVRSSPDLKKQGEEEIGLSIFLLNINIFLPVPASASMYKNCLSFFSVSFNLLAISFHPHY